MLKKIKNYFSKISSSYLDRSKILIVTHSLTYSGAPLVALDLASYLSRYFKTNLINMNPTTDLSLRRKVPKNIETVDFPLWMISYLFRLVNFLIRVITFDKISLRKIWFLWLIIKYKPKYIIFNTYYHTDIQSVSNLFGISSIRYLHENYGYLSKLKIKEIKIINEGTKVIACSPSVIADAKILGIKCEAKFFPATTDRQIKNIQKINTSWGKIKNVDNKVMTVGGGWERKGAQYAEQFATNQRDIKYHWIGEVETPESFKNVIYHGHKLDFKHNIANAFFLISKEDPWPISVLDALANGLVIFGWSHLSIIQELEKYGLAISIPKYDIDLLALEYRNYNFSNHHKKYFAAKEFLCLYSSTKLYENLYKNLY